MLSYLLPLTQSYLSVVNVKQLAIIVQPTNVETVELVTTTEKVTFDAYVLNRSLAMFVNIQVKKLFLLSTCDL